MPRRPNERAMSIGQRAERPKPLPSAPVLELVDQFVPYRMARIEFRLSIVANAIARRFGVARIALRVIAVLARHEKMRISALAERTPLRISALSRILTDMERQGLVARGRVARGAASGDQRAVAVSLTQAGRDLADRVHALFHKINSLLLANFSAEERRSLIGLLRRLEDGAAVVEVQFAAKTRPRRKR